VQEYTDGFRKMALMLDISLQTQETLMKYIGGLPVHIRNTFSCLDPLTLLRFLFKLRILKQGKQVCQGNCCLRGKRTRGKGVAMARIKM
jgi:hypothetical protein